MIGRAQARPARYASIRIEYHKPLKLEHDVRATNLLWPFILLALFTACQQQEKTAMDTPVPASPAVASIGSRTFYASDIDAEIAALPEHLQNRRNDSGLRAQVLKVLIRRYALSQRALAVRLEQDPRVKHHILKARNDILIQSLQQWKRNRLPEPSDGEIRRYYDGHPAEFTIPEQAHARHILVSSEKRAKYIVRLLKHRKDFAMLAAEYSTDDSNKSRGGDLNWFPRGVMVKPFEKAVFALKKPGDISNPVKTQFGWHIIELLGKRPASRQTLEEARDNIAGALKQRALAAWIDDIVAQSDVRIVNPEYRIAGSSRNK